MDASQIIIETVKCAEDGDGLIVRLYEHERTQQLFDLHPGFPMAEVYTCNLLEENEPSLAVTDGKAALRARPYQIVTVRLKPATVEPATSQEVSEQ